jgi:hypothetical protein
MDKSWNDDHDAAARRGSDDENVQLILLRRPVYSGGRGPTVGRLDTNELLSKEAPIDDVALCVFCSAVYVLFS